MAIHTFAAVDVGSSQQELKIFEISRTRGIRPVDSIVRRIDLGTDTYNTGKIRPERVREMAKLLGEFSSIMQNYGVESYKAYGTSAIREMNNPSLVLPYWERLSGIHIDVLSNSEQRFLDYKSVASRGENFRKMISDSCAIVDIGGGSIQISLFDKDVLTATQNMRLGVLRLYEKLSHIDVRTAQRDEMVEELVNTQLEVFCKLYLGERRIHNIIVVDDYISAIMQANHREFIEADEFCDRVSSLHRTEVTEKMDVSDDDYPLLYVSGVLMRCIIRAFGASLIWAPGVTLCDGIVYEYAERRKLITKTHDFEQDIIECAGNISKRYMGDAERGESLQKIALRIFDATKKYHGMGSREKLLLRLAAILHDCGKFISMANLAECSYNIIMSTEIIGLSHIEREIVANVVLFNHKDFVYYEEQENASDLDEKSYTTIARLTAILRVANGLDRAHSHKFDNLHLAIKDDLLVIQADAGVDISLEKGMFGQRAAFFEEVIGLLPVIRQKK